MSSGCADRPTSQHDFSRWAFAGLVVALIAVRLFVVQWELGRGADRGPDSDLHRYREIARADGVPYRDFPVEFPPVTYLAIEALNAGSREDALAAVVVSQFVAEMAVFVLLAVGWGRLSALAYLVAGSGLLVFIYTRLDLLSVALAVGGMFLVRRAHPNAAGVTLAVAVSAKIWPIALVPLLAVQREWKLIRWWLGALAIGVAAWVWLAGISGPADVATFRQADGWHVESVPGSILDLVSRDQVDFEQGTVRVGAPPGWASAVLAAGAVLVILAAARTARSRSDNTGAVALVCVGSLLVFSPLLSPQYISWLAPWAAISAKAGKSYDRVVLLLGALSTLVVALHGQLYTGGSAAELAVHARNILLVALVGIALARLFRDYGTKPSHSVSRVPRQH